MDELFLDNRTAGLIIKFLQEEITETEYQELQAWIGSSDRSREIFEELTSEEKLPGEVNHFVESRKRILEKIRAAEPETRVVVEMNKRSTWKAWLAAAVVVGLAITGYWMYLKNKPSSHEVIVEQQPALNDVAPGKDGAILKLPDGTEIRLDDKKDGAIAEHVTKDGGKLVYSSEANGSAPVYHLMTTPKGRTYRVALSDGSVVWLNAASSLYYPVTFGTERRVEVTGEAYFEVAKDASKKFIVVTKNVSTEVLGTSFNVNTYEDETDSKITLLEGKIRVVAENTTTRPVELKPGQQASISHKSHTSQSIPVQTADVEQVMAWKNGLFKFQGTPMAEMMRQIARWYDVEVAFEGDVKKDDLVTGTIPRNINASEALAILTYAGYNFKIEGKKITVMP